jgi:flagellar hook-length control protein FliK
MGLADHRMFQAGGPKRRGDVTEASKAKWKTNALELEKELARMKAEANQASQQEVKKTMK